MILYKFEIHDNDCLDIKHIMDKAYAIAVEHNIFECTCAELEKPGSGDSYRWPKWELILREMGQDSVKRVYTFEVVNYDKNKKK